MNVIMNSMLVAMILALLIPLYEAWKDENIWQTMLAFSSVATKASLIVLFMSVLRNDWMIGIAAVIIMSVGNAGMMLLAYIIKRVGYSND